MNKTKFSYIKFIAVMLAKIPLSASAEPKLLDINLTNWVASI